MARPDRKKPWSTEKSSGGSGTVLDPPALTEAGAEVQGDRMETPDTTPVQGDGGDVDMVDEPVLKVPKKRKKQGKGQGKKQARKETKVEERESDSDDCISDSVLTFDSQEEQINVVYSAEDIKEFLRNTKWQKNVALEEFFPDRKQFIHDLSERAARELDRELSLEELHETLQTMENGRVSGIDGLLAEFYKAFWAVIGQDVLDVLRDSKLRGELPLSCRRAVLTLLPKKGDLTHLKNWRPVSLLCTDYKLLSKALASRLTKVMERLIHQDQTYCVPDRSIFDNVYLIRDILDVSRLLGLKTGLIFLDQKKAFDLVEHEYLWKVLEAFGFNPGFVAMIRVLYCEIESVQKV
ncbi:hypothetical protein QTP86_008722 [Hemibagrus guttatus]|nr:hypothetical protein QTP86_008722 [Hemibagrus guttatus]